MKKAIDLIGSISCATASWIIHHYNEMASAIVVTMGIILYGFKIRREWRNRNQDQSQYDRNDDEL